MFFLASADQDEEKAPKSKFKHQGFHSLAITIDNRQRNEQY